MYSRALNRKTCPKSLRSPTSKYIHSLGRIASLIFFWGDHIAKDMSRGPFPTNCEWLHARLSLSLGNHVLKTSDDRNAIEDTEQTELVGERWMNLHS